MLLSWFVPTVRLAMFAVSTVRYPICALFTNAKSDASMFEWIEFAAI